MHGKSHVPCAPPHGGRWNYTFPGEDGMDSIAPLPECERQDNKMPSPKWQKIGCGRREE